MTALTDKQIFATYRESGFNMAEAARRLGCKKHRIESALTRLKVRAHAACEEREYNIRKFALLAELRNLEIIR